MPTIWRSPAEETRGLYPGFVVQDDRVSGSITLGRSRLPAWAFYVQVVPEDWDDYRTEETPPGSPIYGITREQFGEFIHNLLEVRGEMARLVLLLADGHRRTKGWQSDDWWETSHRNKVLLQLRRCMDALESA